MHRRVFHRPCSNTLFVAMAVLAKPCQRRQNFCQILKQKTHCLQNSLVMFGRG